MAAATASASPSAAAVSSAGSGGAGDSGATPKAGRTVDLSVAHRGYAHKPPSDSDFLPRPTTVGGVRPAGRSTAQSEHWNALSWPPQRSVSFATDPATGKRVMPSADAPVNRSAVSSTVVTAADGGPGTNILAWSVGFSDGHGHDNARSAEFYSYLARQRARKAVDAHYRPSTAGKRPPPRYGRGSTVFSQPTPQPDEQPTATLVSHPLPANGPVAGAAPAPAAPTLSSVTVSKRPASPPSAAKARNNGLPTDASRVERAKARQRAEAQIVPLFPATGKRPPTPTGSVTAKPAAGRASAAPVAAPVAVSPPSARTASPNRSARSVSSSVPSLAATATLASAAQPIASSRPSAASTAPLSATTAAAAKEETKERPRTPPISLTKRERELLALGHRPRIDTAPGLGYGRKHAGHFLYLSHWQPDAITEADARAIAAEAAANKPPRNPYSAAVGYGHNHPQHYYHLQNLKNLHTKRLHELSFN